MHHVKLDHVCVISQPPVFIIKTRHRIWIFAQLDDILARYNMRQDLFKLRPDRVVLWAWFLAGNRNLW